MTTRMNPMRIICPAAGLLAFFVFCAPGAFTQDSASNLAKTGSPELVGELTKTLSITTAQASGGAGALFGLAKSRLSPADFSKVSASVPGIDGLMKSAPASSGSKSLSGLSGLSGHSGSGALGGLGGLGAVAGSFHKLGMSPDMATKFVPVLTKFVDSNGGSGVASTLAGALK